MARRALLALVACVAVSGCAERSHEGQNRTVPGGAFSVTLPFKLSEPAIFRYGETNLNALAFIAAVKRDIDGQLAEVGGRDAVGRSIRIQLPKPEKSAVVSTIPPRDWDRAGRHAAEFARLTDGARAEAVRQGGLFQRVEIVTVDKAEADATGAEYQLYKSGPDWILKHFAGRSERLSAGASLAAFAASVQSAVPKLRNPADGLTTRVQRDPDRLIQAFNGKEYTDAAQLDQAVRAYYEADSTRARPLTQGLGGRALVLVPEAPTIKPLFPSADLNAAMLAGYRAWANAVNGRTVAVMQRSALFDEMTVMAGEADSPPQGDHDWVLWQKPGQAMIWYARAKGGDPGRLVINAETEEAGAELAGQLRKIRG